MGGEQWATRGHGQAYLVQQSKGHCAAQRMQAQGPRVSSTTALASPEELALSRRIRSTSSLLPVAEGQPCSPAWPRCIARVFLSPEMSLLWYRLAFNPSARANRPRNRAARANGDTEGRLGICAILFVLLVRALPQWLLKQLLSRLHGVAGAKSWGRTHLVSSDHPCALLAPRRTMRSIHCTESSHPAPQPQHPLKRLPVSVVY